jgi:hypothetical protein
VSRPSFSNRYEEQDDGIWGAFSAQNRGVRGTPLLALGARREELMCGAAKSSPPNATIIPPGSRFNAWTNLASGRSASSTPGAGASGGLPSAADERRECEVQRVAEPQRDVRPVRDIAGRHRAAEQDAIGRLEEPVAPAP